MSKAEYKVRQQVHGPKKAGGQGRFLDQILGIELDRTSFLVNEGFIEVFTPEDIGVCRVLKGELPYSS